MRVRPIGILVSSLIVALASSATLVGAAQASPAWHFNKEELVGKETILAHAVKASFVIPGLTTTCKPFVLKMAIFNVSKVGKGEVTQVPLSNCSTDSEACAVGSIQAEKLPWPAFLMTKGSDYLVLEGVRVDIVYEGEECVLDGTLVAIKGTAGGLVDDKTESVTFSPASFAATGTSLGVGVEWNSASTMLATGSRLGQSLTVE